MEAVRAEPLFEPIRRSVFHSDVRTLASTSRRQGQQRGTGTLAAEASAAPPSRKGGTLMELVPRDDPRVTTLSVALEPYAWWSATPEMLARRAVGVLDRHWLLGELPGPRSPVRLRDVDPAEASDERVVVLAASLRALRWRALTRVALSRQLVSALESWWIRRRFAEVERAFLLDGDA